MTITLTGAASCAGARAAGNAEDPAVPNGGVPEKVWVGQAAEEPLEPELPLAAPDFEPEPEEPEPDEDPFDDVDADDGFESDDELDEEDDLSLEPPESPEPFEAPALAGVLLDDEPRLSFR